MAGYSALARAACWLFLSNMKLFLTTATGRYPIANTFLIRLCTLGLLRLIPVPEPFSITTALGENSSHERVFLGIR